MRRQKKWFYVVVALCVITFVSCGDGGDGPTSPGLDPNVAGTWLFLGQLSSNNCTALQDVPDFQIGVPLTGQVVVAQNGQNLTAENSSGELTYAGTVSGDSFTLTQTNPLRDTAGSCTFAIGSDIVVNRTSDNSGSGSLSLTTTQISGDCSFLGPLPCSVVSTGSWERTSAAKLENREYSTDISSAQQIQQLIKITQGSVE